MRFLSLVVGLLMVAPGAAAQIDPIEILDQIEAARQQRLTNVQNYSIVVQTNLTPMPSVEYYERAVDDIGNPVAAFRLVPPNELADRAAVASGQPTSGQMMDGMADAVGVMAGILGSAAAEAGVDVRSVLGARAGEAAAGLRGMASGPDMDTNSDALEGLAHMQMLRDYATSARDTTWQNRPAFIVEAISPDGVELDIDDEGVSYFANKIILIVDKQYLVPLVLWVRGEGRPAAVTSPRFPVGVAQMQTRFRTLAPSTMYEPTCRSVSFSSMATGGFQMARTKIHYLELNQGPPSQQVQAGWLADAVEAFEEYACEF